MEEKQTMVISCSQMLTAWYVEDLKKEFNLITINCVPDLNKLYVSEGEKVIYVLGGQERLFNKLAELIANIAEIIIFIGEQPETYVDIPFFEEKGIPVVKTGGGARAVAEKTLSQIASPDRLRDWAARKLIWAPDYDEDVVDKMLKKQSVMIVGAGNIGTQLLKELAGKVGKLRYSGGRGEKKVLAEQGFIYEPDLVKAFEADVVTLHLSLGDDTKMIIKKEHMERIFVWGCFINNARAELVIPEDLHYVMKMRPDIGVFWDVLWDEGASFPSVSGVEKEIIQMPSFHFGHHSAIAGDPRYRKKSINEYCLGLEERLKEFKLKKSVN